MNAKSTCASAQVQDFPNGAGAAALLAAGIGSFMVAFFAILADKSAAIKSLMIFYKPTGPLSGVTTCSAVAWILCWAILDRRWRRRMVSLGPISTIALILLGLSLLLTFPPIVDLF
jgi:predicted exporter